MTFLIQNKWGGIHGVALDADLTPSQPAMVRPNVDNQQYPMITDLDAFPDGGYQLTALGKVLPIGNARLPFAAWVPIQDATALAMAPSEGGGWIASGNTVKTIGRPTQLIFPSRDKNDTLVDIEYDPQQMQLALLSRKGTIAICGHQESRLVGTIPLKKDRAIDIEFSPDGYWVLTEQGKVYSWTPEKITLVPGIPDLGKGFACDLERSLIGEGFYILDIFGVIHACAGAPKVPTEPLTKPVAIDLEIIPGNILPRWDPPGLHTQVSWGISSVLLDPQGPSKPVSLVIEKAEHMTRFLTQIHYDPQLIEVDPYSVRVGAWWDQGLRVSRINPVVNPENGIMKLQGSGDYSPYEGASGGGELARFAVTPATGVTEATTVLIIEEFFFRDAYQENIDHACPPLINSCTIYIAPIRPQLGFSWKRNQEWVNEKTLNVKPGEIIQADIWIENGSRLGQFELDFRFSNENLRYLGMTPGDVWRSDVDIKTAFDIPSLANQSGGLQGQGVEAQQPGACLDQRGAIVSLFFVILSPGQAEIHLDQLISKDHQGSLIELEIENKDLTSTCD